MNKKQAIRDFENMRNNAELNTLSKTSLERPLDDREFKRFGELMENVHGYEEVSDKK